MMILALVRDYHNQHRIVNEGGWHIADAVHRSYDVEGMHIGTIAAGRIGYDMLRKMHPFDVHLHYFDKHRLSSDHDLSLIYVYQSNASEHQMDASFSTCHNQYDQLQLFQCACLQHHKICEQHQLYANHPH